MWHSQDHGQIVVVMALLFIQVVIGALRWRLLLHYIAAPEDGLKLGRWAAFEMYYISVFFGNCIPGGAMSSDVVRVWLAKARHIPMTLSINSVIIDRMIALVALGLLVLLRLPELGRLLGFNADPILVAAAVAMILGVWVLINIEKFSKSYIHLRVVRWLVHFIHSLRKLADKPLRSMLLVVYAITIHVLFCVCAYVLAKSLDIQLTLMQAITVLPFVILAVTLPISIGGWGVREAGMAGMLGLVGVAKTPAVLLSIQMGILAIVVYVPAGILWLIARRRGQ